MFRPMSRSTFRCIAGCHGAYALDEILYRCPKCGDLLEVVHDIEALKTRGPAAWMESWQTPWGLSRFFR